MDKVCFGIKYLMRNVKLVGENILIYRNQMTEKTGAYIFVHFVFIAFFSSFIHNIFFSICLRLNYVKLLKEFIHRLRQLIKMTSRNENLKCFSIGKHEKKFVRLSTVCYDINNNNVTAV